MIVHVWERALQANIGPVLVACGDQEILEALKAYGGEGILTDPSLPSGTDRIKAALDIYDPHEKYETIINMQGDLPTLDSSLLCQVLEPFQNPVVEMTTLANLIDDPHELADPNTVKVALSLKTGDSIGRALYFSRNPLPSGEGPHYHHIGIYAYGRECLNRFVSLPVDPLEAREKLEQLRALGNGMRLDVKVVNTSIPFGVDTPGDLEKARRIIENSSA
jgi:3-deoxy-manno-octulosonate cytidylyltransferase (CMP-KDO synthetase)